jgi:ATP-binding cassette subfamily F protein 3
MLLRPSNTLLLDEPTNHLDLDSKDVLLDALEDFGGTLIFVSHDRYFVEKLANRIVEVGFGDAHSFPGRYEEFLWRKAHPPSPALESHGRASARPGRHEDGQAGARLASGRPAGTHGGAQAGQAGAKAQAQATPAIDRESRRQAQTESRRRDRAVKAHLGKIAELEERIARCEAEIKQIESTMAGPEFYQDRAASQPVIDRHQALMWQVGDLMHQWEELQASAQAQPAVPPTPSTRN